jgi:hypothetical protein
MNKRIRELHIQAQQEAFNEPIDIENCAVADIKGFSQQVYEKFAELIVRECAQVGFDYADGHCCEISAVILEHFGVKE